MQAFEITSDDLDMSQVNLDVLSILNELPDKDLGYEHLGSSSIGLSSSEAQFRSQRALQSHDRGLPSISNLEM
jgi:hypothetical protein